VRTVQPPEGWEGEAYTGDGPAINSANDEISLDGLGLEEAKTAIVAWLEAKGLGAGTVTYRLRDWLFSRQRYWGEPFPVGYDADSEPESPLSRLPGWVEVELDLGDGPRTYRRETSTMPNWAGSCWYELRYLDPRNDRALVDPEIDRYWMGPRPGEATGGVDLYVGGVEHAVLHLLYARFWQKVLYDLGHVSSSEPFHTLFNQGYIQAYAYTDARGVYVPAEEVETSEGPDGEPVFTWRGEPVT